MTIGEKIKFFRNRSKLSQGEVELNTDLAFGVISRIESGKTQPTKETLFKLARTLNLNKLEIDYLIGITDKAAGGEELEKVISELSEYFNKKGTLAYLLDERDRMLYVSKDLIKLLGLTEENVKRAIGRPLTELILDPTFQIYDIINTEDFEEVLRRNLVKNYYDICFMIDDPYYERTIKAVNSNPISKKVWEEISKNPPVNINTLESRKVKFNLNGNIVEMVYSAEYVATNSRFFIIEYTPTNLVYKLLSKII